jgi:hypothetical protein
VQNRNRYRVPVEKRNEEKVTFQVLKTASMMMTALSNPIPNLKDRAVHRKQLFAHSTCICHQYNAILSQVLCEFKSPRKN